MSVISKLLGLIIISLNAIFFIPLTVTTIKSGGAAISNGNILLSMTFISHLFLISALGAWINKSKRPTTLLLINSLGAVWMVCCLALFKLAPII